MVRWKNALKSVPKENQLCWVYKHCGGKTFAVDDYYIYDGAWERWDYDTMRWLPSKETVLYWKPFKAQHAPIKRRLGITVEETHAIKDMTRFQRWWALRKN